MMRHCAERFKMEPRFAVDAENGKVGNEVGKGERRDMQDFLFNDVDSWLRALRYLAIDVKQMIVYAYTASVYIVKHSCDVCLKEKNRGNFCLGF